MMAGLEKKEHDITLKVLYQVTTVAPALTKEEDFDVLL